MNGLLLLGITSVILIGAYLLYGRYLVKSWGIDPNAKTPAIEKEDGTDFVPSSKWEVFAHQFSSIAGAGPVTGPVMAMMWGWLPAFLWIVVGGIFFGAVQDFGALYASVKSHGKSMGQLIEDYIGKKGRRLFFLFAWLFTLLVIAAFADMVAGTLNGFSAEGAKLQPNAAAAIDFHFVCICCHCFRIILEKNKDRRMETGRDCHRFDHCHAGAAGIACPLYLDKSCMDLHRFCLYFLCVCHTDVAVETAA